ncbi:MAG: DUF1631 domain-containing protein [Thermochromatium sp.]
MVKQPNSNVIPFGFRATDPPEVMDKDTLTILQTCRERLIDAVLAVFTRHIGRANEELLAMMDRASDQTQRQLCFDAISLLSNRSHLLLQQLRLTYLRLFDEAIERLGFQEGQISARSSDELKLVDQEDFELELALTKLTTRASLNCAQPLLALDRRLAALLKVSRITPEENPLRPSALYRALLQTLTSMEADPKLAIFLMQSFERQTSAELPEIYNDLNRYLIESGILPTIPLNEPYPRNPGGIADASGLIGASERSAADSVMSSAAAMPPDDVFSYLVRSFQQLASPPIVPSEVPRAMASTPASVGPSMVQSSPLDREQLVQMLGSLQRGLPLPGVVPDLGTRALNPWADDVFAQLRATPLARGATPVDSLTIDIVAMLFEAIFDDPDLPAAIRAEIAKLQIPILKVALLDKRFFSDRKHPARRLLDVIAHAGLGQEEHEDPQLLETIRSVVTAVIDGFESDIGVIASQVERLESTLASHDSRLQAATDQLAASLAQRERQERVVEYVDAVLQERLARPGIPDPILEFLKRGWREVLSDSFVHHGESDPQWTQAVQLMDDLIWSIEPKTQPAERERFIGQLPNLIQGLRTRLAHLGLEETWNAFFNQLIQYHVAALRGEGTAIPATPPPSPPARVGTPAPATLDPHLKLVLALEPGAWVEFYTERGTRNTLRLSWVSEFKGVYLFTNRQGENTLTLAAASLADRLRKGSARLLSKHPLSERAIARLMERIQPTEGAPGA